MPVTTRSQSKNIPRIKLVTNESTMYMAKPIETDESKLLQMNQQLILQLERTNRINLELEQKIKNELWNKTDFIDKIKEKLHKCEISFGQETKMRFALDIFNIFTDEIHHLFDDNLKWTIFISTVYNKTTEFENEFSSGKYNSVEDKELIKEFTFVFRRIRNLLTLYFIRKRHISVKNDVISEVLNIYKDIDAKIVNNIDTSNFPSSWSKYIN